MQTLDVDLLKTFVAVVETGSFTRAGYRLSRTQSAVSAQLKRLESRVNQHLIVRTQGRVGGLTAAGEQLISHAERLIRIHDETLAALGQPRLAGTVRVGLPDELAHDNIAQALANFRKHHPLVGLEVTCQLSVELDALIARSELDLALINCCDANAPPKERLYSDELVWVSGHEFTPGYGEPVALIGSPTGCAYRTRAIQALEQAGQAWTSVYTSTSFSGVSAAVAAGLGVAAMPARAVSRTSHQLIRYPSLPALAGVDVILRQSAHESPETVTCLSRYIRDQFAETGDEVTRSA